MKNRQVVIFLGLLMALIISVINIQADVVLQVLSNHVFLPVVFANWPLQPPGTPVLNDIDNPDGDGNYTVSWSSVSGAEGYNLQEDDQSSFPNPTTLYSGTATSQAMSGREVATYYYRVNASNSAGEGGWSNVKSVTVTVPPPACDVTCGANGGWWADISCETGSSSSKVFSLQYWDDNRGWVRIYDVERTYDESGNTYDMIAEYWRVSSGGATVARMWVDVSGGVFGDNKQHCQNY